MRIVFAFIFISFFCISSFSAGLMIHGDSKIVFLNDINQARIFRSENGRRQSVPQLEVCAWGGRVDERACCIITMKSDADALSLLNLLTGVTNNTLRLHCFSKIITNIASVIASDYEVEYKADKAFGFGSKIIPYKDY